MRPFALERFFAKYEFTARFLLSASDCESLRLDEVLGMADEETRALWENLRLSYTDSQGHPLLRREIAGLYDTVSPDEILVCVPEEGILIAMHSLLSKGEAFLYTAPAYQSLFEIGAALGCPAHPLVLRVAGDRWELDIAEIARKITPRTRLLVINFPHNPTGFLPTRAQFEELLELARQHNLFVFSDEMYRFLEHDEASRLPSACELYENAVSLGGLSKSFSLPGLRIGWLATHHAVLREKLQQFKDYTTICGSAPAEILGIMALRAKEGILAQNRRRVAENLSLARQFFEREHPDKFHWIEPEGSSVAFPMLRKGCSVEEFAEAAVNRHNLMILPGSIYEYPGNHFRVGLGRANFAAALGALGELVAAGCAPDQERPHPRDRAPQA